MVGQPRLVESLNPSIAQRDELKAIAESIGSVEALDIDRVASTASMANPHGEVTPRAMMQTCRLRRGLR